LGIGSGIGGFDLGTGDHRDEDDAGAGNGGVQQKVAAIEACLVVIFDTHENVLSRTDVVKARSRQSEARHKL
jgi:hypothetical protein